MSDKRNNSARKITYSAVATALSLVMIVLSAFVPVFTIAPLVITVLCWNIVFDKCGIPYGIATMLATIALGFLTAIGAGFAIMIIVGIVFVPYTIIVLLTRKITYTKPHLVAIRIVILAAFASLALMGLYFTAGAIMEYVDIGRIISAISGDNFALGYILINVLAVAIVIVLDLLYSYLSPQITKRLK